MAIGHGGGVSTKARIPVALVASFIVVAAGCASSTEDVSQSTAAVDSICNEKASASIDGIPAYAYCGNTNVWSNNGVDTKNASGGTGWVQTEHGYGYQCVEFAVRYMRFKWNVSTSWGVSYAKQMCAKHPSGVTVTTKPVHGDLVVFGAGSCGADPTAGHVAVVDTVGSTSFVAVQENTAGRYTYKDSCASCFLHAASNVPPAPDSGSNDAAAEASDANSVDAENDAAADAAPQDDAAPDGTSPPDAGGAVAGGGGCSSAPGVPSNGWIAVALGFVVATRQRRGAKKDVVTALFRRARRL